MNRLVISPAARADLEQASRYGDETFGESATDRYFDDLDRTLQLIADTPLMARERKEFSPAVRIHRHGRHYIIYGALRDHVRIIRVLSDRADIGRHLRRLR